MRITRLLGFISISLLVLAGAGCGTPGAPQPPSLDLPRPVEDLAATRKGNLVVLEWTQPSQTTDRRNIRRPAATRVCRAIGQLALTQCGDIVASLTPEQITSATSQGQRPHVVFNDTLPAANSATGFATYAIEALSPRDRSAGLSNQVRVSLAPTLPAPQDVRAQLSPEGVAVSWTGLTRSAAPKSPALGFRYRLLRRPAGQGSFVIVEELPLDSAVRTVPDHSFEWEQTYEYKVTSVTEVVESGQATAEVEGEDSPAIKIFVHDTFPPVQATGLQAVFSGVGQKPSIDLTWAPNAESDVAGYNVFRHEAGTAPQKINAEPVKSSAYRDPEVAAGHTYFYAVSAIDLRGNESPRSEETSETVPEVK
ncbi:MAG TPA: hypothetical protein VN622_07950 [Clostridia bacterium]|nr:hypothetical protein [Clostridia bacterium]